MRSIHLRVLSALTLILALGLTLVSLILTRIVGIRSHYPQGRRSFSISSRSHQIGKISTACVECNKTCALVYYDSHSIAVIEVTFISCSLPSPSVALLKGVVPKFLLLNRSGKWPPPVCGGFIGVVFLFLFLNVHQEGRSFGRFQMAMGEVFLLPGGLAWVRCTLIERTSFGSF